MKSIIYNVLLFVYNKTRKTRLVSFHHAVGDIIYRDIERNYPPVLSPIESIQKLLAEQASIGRFGDGEFRLMRYRSISFQDRSRALQKRLHEVLHSNVKGFYPAVVSLQDETSIASLLTKKKWHNKQMRSWNITKISALRLDYRRLYQQLQNFTR